MSRPIRSGAVRIAIVGANFAGLSAAMRLNGRCDVTVFDPRPDFEFLPNIHELLSGVKQPAHLRLDKTDVVKRCGHRFVPAAVKRIDPLQQKIFYGRRRWSFDFCLVCVGGIHATGGIKGSQKAAMPFKTVNHGWAIGQHLKPLFREQRCPRIQIVGAGLEGIEVLGEILRRYRNRPDYEIHLIERHRRLLPQGPAALDGEIRRLCQPYPVFFHTRRKVTGLTAKRVRLSSGTALPTDLTIWTTGAVPPPLLFKSNLAAASGQWAPVNTSLQSSLHECVFVAGDAAHMAKPISKQAYHAIAMGRHAAGNIQATIAGKPHTGFKPALKPQIVSFGDLQTFVVGGRFVLAGSVLAGLKEAIYQSTMAAFDPPLRPGAALQLYRRSRAAFDGLLRPSLASIERLSRLPQVKVLWQGPQP